MKEIENAKFPPEGKGGGRVSGHISRRLFLVPLNFFFGKNQNQNEAFQHELFPFLLLRSQMRRTAPFMLFAPLL